MPAAILRSPSISGARRRISRRAVITGTAYPYETLTSSQSGQWYADGSPVISETGDTYKIRVADSGKIISQNGAFVQIPGVARFAKTSFADVSDFTVTGVAPSIVSSAIRVPATAFASWNTQRMILNAVCNDRDWSIIAKLKFVNTSGSGFALGKLSVNTWGPTSAASTSPSPTANFYAQFSGSAGSPISPATGTPPTIAAGDVIEWRLQSYRQTLTSTFKNLTSGLSGTRTAARATNSGSVGFAGVGSTIDVQEFGYIADCPALPKVICIGDSKTAGTAMDGNISYADRLNSEYRARIFAGPSDRTVETVQSLANFIGTGATFAIVSIGRNDLASAVASGTWQANYSSIITALKADGLSICHLVIPETGQSQTTLRNWLNSTYPSDYKEYLPGWVNASHLGVDGIHPSEAGAEFIAATLEASGMLPAI